MSKKEYNTHKYPQANHQPRHKAADRMGRAQARIEINAPLTLEQKLAKLPPEPFSKKERARLLSALENRNAPKPVKVEHEASTEVEVVTKQAKKLYMKGNKNETV